MYADSISNEEITNLPKLLFTGEIAIANSPEDIEMYLPRIMSEPIAGFDTETKPSFRKGETNQIALIQLAIPNFALLIRVRQTGVTPSLISYFESEKYLKVGAAIRDDLKGLKRQRGFEPKGFIDLQAEVPKFGIASVSVRKMAAIVLQVRVSKSQQLSNWEAPVLSEPQMQYAALDAWACREIYMKLMA
jgi:ribonuclease D